MDAAFRIRNMADGDIGHVLAVEQASFPSPWSEGMLREELAHSLSRPRVAACRNPGEGILGYCISWLVAGEIHLQRLAVRNDARRRGVARALMQDMLQGAASRGVFRAILDVRPSNGEAIRLYESFGFAPVGRRPGYYRESGEDGIVMENLLSREGES